MTTHTDLIGRARAAQGQTMSTSFLRRVLLADAAVSTATGALLIVGAGLLEGLLAVPANLLRGSGVSLLPFGALVAWLATRERLPRRAVWAVIAYNALWAADSVLLLFTGWIEPAVLGYAFIVAQAAVVALFAEAEYLGLRRSDATA